MFFLKLVQEFELIFPKSGHLFARNFPSLLEKLDEHTGEIHLDMNLDQEESSKFYPSHILSMS